MKTTVRTSLAIGGTKKVFGVKMYDNKKFEKQYSSVEEFLKDFQPSVSSSILEQRIKTEFSKPSGKITFKPKGYKANQIFFFKNVD